MSFSCIQSDNGGTSNWIGTCASDDFKNIACISSTNGYSGIRISNDYGNTWYDVIGGLVNNSSTAYFRAVCCSSDFSKITAVRQGGGIWTSTDYGLNWTQVASGNITGGASGWYSVCGSSNMQTQYAVQTSGNIFKSTDGGANWTSIGTAAGSRNWRSICCDPSGQKVAAVASGTGGGIFISGDSGTTWYTSNSATSNWRSIACSRDFTKLVAVVDQGGGIFTTTNPSTTGSSTWTQITGYTTGYDFVIVGCSADFKNIMATSWGTGNSSFVYSTDYGTNWTAYTVNKYWSGCAIKNNRYVAISGNTGNIHIGRFGYDSSLFKIKGGQLQNMISSVPAYNSNTGTLVEQPLFYTMPVLWFLFYNGSGTFVSKQSQSSLMTLWLSRSTAANVTYESMPTQLPNSYALYSTVVKFTNTANTTAVSYMQSDPIIYFKSISISFWIYPLLTGSTYIGVGNKYTILFNFANSSTGAGCIDIGFDGNSSKLVLALNSNFISKCVSATTISTTSWTHVTCTFNELTLTGNIYINGQLDNTYNLGVIPNFYNALLVGLKWGFNNSSSGGYQGYHGYLASFEIYNKEITAYEANKLYYNSYLPDQKSQLTCFKGISSTTGYATTGGGFPMLRGQPPFGATPYSKVTIPYKIAGQTIPDFAPFYTVYEGTSYLTGATHTLQPWTTRIFVIAIGGGGGGGGGNYQTQGNSGGAGGGGGGAGMAYAYCNVTQSNAITLDVNAGGMGGFTADVAGSGTISYVGGNGLNGTTTTVYIDGQPLVRGYFGNKAKNQYNNNTNRSSKDVTSTTENNLGGAPGRGGPGRIFTTGSLSITNGTSYQENSSSGSGFVGTYNGIIISGTSSGYYGEYGQNDTETTTASAGGGGGSGGNFDAIQINGQDFIFNSSDYKFINYVNSNVFCNGSTIRTAYGAGGKGGNGESQGGSPTGGSQGNPGAVFIFEYCA